MTTEKLLKKLGYGYSISYCSYRKKFFVSRIGEWSVGREITPESRLTKDKSAKKAIKKYIKKYIKKS